MEIPSSFQSLMVDAVGDNFNISGATVLELASDPDLLAASAFIHRGAEHVIASDLNERWTKEAPAGVETATIDACNIHLEDQSVDIIFGINLLEHLIDIPSALRSISRVLRPGGFCLLHGHPLWTSSRGHHVMVGDGGAEAHFEHSNPLPLWAHLYMDRAAMLEQLPAEVGAEVVAWCFDTDHISRRPRRAIMQDLSSSPLNLSAIWEDRLEAPRLGVLDRLRNCSWWHDEEDFSVRGLTAILSKS